MHHMLGNHFVQVWVLLCQVSFLMKADIMVDITWDDTSECVLAYVKASPMKGSRCPRGGVNWANSKFLCNN